MKIDCPEKYFKDGHETIEDIHPPTSRNEDNVLCVGNVLNSDRQLNVRMIENHVGTDKMSVDTIIPENLQMRKTCAIFVQEVRKKPASWSMTTWPRATSQRFPRLPTVMADIFLFSRVTTTLK